MDLLTKGLMRQIPMDQENLGEHAVVYCKFFTPTSNWTWYVTEAVAYLQDGGEVSLAEVAVRNWTMEVELEDVRFFGFVRGFEGELGYFSLRELQTVKGPLGLGIERDLYWRQTELKDVMSDAL